MIVRVCLPELKVVPSHHRIAARPEVPSFATGHRLNTCGVSALAHTRSTRMKLVIIQHRYAELGSGVGSPGAPCRRHGLPLDAVNCAIRELQFAVTVIVLLQACRAGHAAMGDRPTDLCPH